MSGYSSGLVEVQEQILAKSTYSMVFPANTASQLESITHPFGLTPLIDYKISVDGGTTFFSPTSYREVGVTFSIISCYADDSYIYFSVNNNGSNPALNSEYNIVYQYRAYVTEIIRS